MAINDWDGNGKKDIFDDTIEYQMYVEATKEDESQINNYKHNTSDPFLKIIVWVAVIAVILFISNIIHEFSKDCVIYKCTNKTVSGSIYCSKHHWKNAR